MDETGYKAQPLKSFGTGSCLNSIELFNDEQVMTLGGTRRVGGLLGVAGRLSGTVSPFRGGTGDFPCLSGESPGQRSLVS